MINVRMMFVYMLLSQLSSRINAILKFSSQLHSICYIFLLIIKIQLHGIVEALLFRAF